MGEVLTGYRRVEDTRTLALILQTWEGRGRGRGVYKLIPSLSFH